MSLHTQLSKSGYGFRVRNDGDWGIQVDIFYRGAIVGDVFFLRNEPVPNQLTLCRGAIDEDHPERKIGSAAIELVYRRYGWPIAAAMYPQHEPWLSWVPHCMH